jgi:UDP-N-acetylglucosamine 4,6-dehydratase
MSYFEGSFILITGGTGSFGKAVVPYLLDQNPEKIIIYSRDELKQHDMARVYNQDCMRYLVGDVRDLDRLARAMAGVTHVIHAAAMKQVPTCEYNPIEAIKTNILGTKNVVLAAHQTYGVQAVVLLSSDKACAPLNLYGATKMVAEKLFVHGHVYSSGKYPRLSVVRYGNVVGSRGSVIPIFQKQAATGVLKVTDRRMTRFWMTLAEAVAFVLDTLRLSPGRQIWVPKLPAMRIIDLAEAIAPMAKIELIGRRPGEKLHELLVAPGESYRTAEHHDKFIILPDEPERIAHYKDVLTLREQYSSDCPYKWLTPTELRSMI